MLRQYWHLTPAVVIIGSCVAGFSQACQHADLSGAAHREQLLTALEEMSTVDFVAVVRRFELASVLASETRSIRTKLTSSNPRSRVRAAILLGAIGKRRAIEFPNRLLDLASSPHDSDRLAAAISLACFIGRDSAVTASLRALAQDSSGKVRSSARIALLSNPKTQWIGLSLGPYRSTDSAPASPLKSVGDEVAYYLEAVFD